MIGNAVAGMQTEHTVGVFKVTTGVVVVGVGGVE